MSSSAKVVGKTVWAWPPAAQTTSYRSSQVSTRVRIGSGWPSGATPPIVWPVAARTNSGVALVTFSAPTRAATRLVSTRWAPLVRTSRGAPSAANTRLLAIAPTAQPSRSAAAWAVGAASESSTIAPVPPSFSRQAATISTFGCMNRTLGCSNVSGVRGVQRTSPWRFHAGTNRGGRGVRRTSGRRLYGLVLEPCRHRGGHFAARHALGHAHADTGACGAQGAEARCEGGGRAGASAEADQPALRPRNGRREVRAGDAVRAVGVREGQQTQAQRDRGQEGLGRAGGAQGAQGAHGPARGRPGRHRSQAAVPC